MATSFRHSDPTKRTYGSVSAKGKPSQASLVRDVAVRRKDSDPALAHEAKSSLRGLEGRDAASRAIDATQRVLERAVPASGSSETGDAAAAKASQGFRSLVDAGAEGARLHHHDVVKARADAVLERDRELSGPPAPEAPTPPSPGRGLPRRAPHGAHGGGSDSGFGSIAGQGSSAGGRAARRRMAAEKAAGGGASGEPAQRFGHLHAAGGDGSPHAGGGTYKDHALDGIADAKEASAPTRRLARKGESRGIAAHGDKIDDEIASSRSDFRRSGSAARRPSAGRGSIAKKAGGKAAKKAAEAGGDKVADAVRQGASTRRGKLSRALGAAGTAASVARRIAPGKSEDLEEDVTGSVTGAAKDVARRGGKAALKKGRQALRKKMGADKKLAEKAKRKALKKLDPAHNPATASAEARRANIRRLRKALGRGPAASATGAAKAGGNAVSRAVRKVIAAIVKSIKDAIGAIVGAISSVFGGGMVAFSLTAVPVMLIVAIACSGLPLDASAAGGISSTRYIAKAREFAADDSIGYSQATRYHNPNMDCSSFVYYSLIDSGCCTTDQLGSSPFSTYTMADALSNAGFQIISWSDIGDVSNLQAGDILINTSKHTEIYVGDGKNIGAHKDIDGVNGDSSGKEVCENDYWYDNWDCVARPPASMVSDVGGDAQSIWNWLKQNGFSDAAAAGIMGNIQQESSFNPAAEEAGGPGRGLFQWTYGSDRWNGLLALAQASGKDWTDAGVQMAFMLQELPHELATYDGGGVSLDEFKSTNDVEWAARKFGKAYERYGIEGPRTNYALAIYSQFAGRA